MKEIDITLSFKSRLELFLIKLKVEWKWRKAYGFHLGKLLKDLFFPKPHKALFG